MKEMKDMNDMKDMLPVSVVGLDCYINSLLTVVNWRLGEYYLAFWDAWCFQYVPKEALGESIEYPMSNVLTNIKNHYNYVFENLEDGDKKQRINQMIKILESNMPIILCMDMYFCGWTESYGKDHVEHIIVVNGYQNGKFLILDTMPVRVGVEVDASDVFDGMIWAKQVDFSKNESELVTMEEYLIYTLERIEANREFEQFAKFVNEISTEKLSMDLQYDGYVWSVPLLNNLRRLYGSRKQFLFALEEISGNNAMEKTLAEKIRGKYEDIIKQWGVIVNLVYKFRTIGRIKRNNDIKERFERLLALEKTVYMVIYDLLEKKQVMVYERFKTELIVITFQNNFQSHFSGNEDFERVSELPKELLVADKSIKFNFNENQNNCISCCGQQKIVDIAQVIKLHFVGYSTWGNQIGNVKLTFNGWEEKVEICLSDWCWGENFCEKILWKGKFVTKNEKKQIYNAYIYDVEVSIPIEKQLTKVTLPENEKMLLFGVYAERLLV